LLGAKYILLRKEFWDDTQKEIKENIESIMITFGGDDVRKMTPNILKLLTENYPCFIKRVIIGKGFHGVGDIENLKDEKTKLIYYPDANKMKKIMLESDIAISAGGQTLYELAKIGVPTIAVGVSDNQLNNIKGLQKAGFVKYAGWWQNDDVYEKINYYIKSFENFNRRIESFKNGRRLIDGKGSKLIIEFLTNSYYIFLKNMR
jgi:spore coat polysaccharide biosynthesis predicted glycosyltransferase SpsG